jgi:DNA-binding MarR family transcriptional regulator
MLRIPRICVKSQVVLSGRGGKRSPGSRKRTDAQREAQLIRIGEMQIEGKSQYEIAEELGLSQSQVRRDLKEIVRRGAATPPADKAAVRDELVKVSRHMRKKLFAAYNRSTQDKEVQTKKQVAVQGAENNALNGGRKAKVPSERMEASLRSEGQCGQCGNPAFMS